MIKSTLVLTFILLCYAGSYAQQGDPWKTFTSAEGKFSILLPCTPEVKTDDSVETATQKPVYIRCMANNAIFLITYVDFPKGYDAKSILNSYLNGVAEETPMTPGSKKEISISSYPGLEFVVKRGPGENDFCYTWRIYYVKERLYGVSMATRASAADPALTAKYFSSFTLLK